MGRLKKVRIIQLRVMLEWTLIVGIGLMVVIYNPYGGIAYEVPRKYLLVFWSSILGVLSYLVWIRQVKPYYRKKVLYSIFAFLSLVLVSSLLGVNFSKSVVGNYYRVDGLYALFSMIMVAWAVAVSRVDFGKIAGTISVSVILVMVGVLGQFVGLLNNDFDFGGIFSMGIAGVFGNPNFLAGFLVVSSPFVLYLSETTKGFVRYISWITFSLLILGIFMSSSYGGGVGLLVVVSIWLIQKMGTKKRILGYVAAMLVVFVTLGSYIMGVSLEQSYWTGDWFQPESRERIIIKGLKAVNNRPIFGWGWANFDYAFRSVDWPVYDKDDVYVDKAHMMWLEVLSTTGVLGFSVYLYFIFQVYKSIELRSGRIRKYLTLVLIAYLVHSQLNVISIVEDMVFWIIVGYSVIEVD